jgi:hypothetical protein
MSKGRRRPSRLIRWLMRLVEKWLGRYYEGPDAPRRLTEELRLWLALNPDAPREVVVGYAACLVEAAYRDGFVRGYEWQERDWKGPSVDPEVMAELQAQDWSLAESNPRVRRILTDGYDADDPLANVSAPDKRQFFDFLARAQDIRVVPEPIQYEDES